MFRVLLQCVVCAGISLTMLTAGQRANTHYSGILLDAFAERKAKNPAFSLRAFARYLGISPAALSQVLSGKRDLSRKNAAKVADRLGLSPTQAGRMLSQIRGENSDSVDFNEHRLIQEDIFKVMSDWYYFAILNLARIPDNQAEHEWIAKRLGISSLEVRTAVVRLERLGFIEIKSKRLVRTTAPLTTTDGVPSSALRTYHKQNLRLAEVSIDRDSVDLRNVSSLTMAVCPDELPEAVKEISKFKKRFSKMFGSQNPSEVYTLAIQLFPVTIPKKRAGETV